MRPDRFQVRDETIDELNEIIERLYQYVDAFLERGMMLDNSYWFEYYKLIKSAREIREIVHELKNNLAVFPITPRGFRLEIYDVVNRAERLLREYELLD